MQTVLRNAEQLRVLLGLTLNPERSGPSALQFVAALSPERAAFLSVAFRNHVVIRAFEVVHRLSADADSRELTDWTASVVAAERARIDNALHYLAAICEQLEQNGCPVTVLKSLDHIPDLGSDLDLYTTADSRNVISVMFSKFEAQQQPRSVGDRLANKWNFTVPGLPESVEIHVQRLGQAGEHTMLAQRFFTRRLPKEIGMYRFWVPGFEEVILAATFQRMYRHFFLRVCDVVNTANIIQKQQVDFTELKAAADIGSVWPGVATYLSIVSDFVRDYREERLNIPDWVSAAGWFGNDKLFCRRAPFLRLPLIPEVIRLYASQLTGNVLGGQLSAAMRLSILPGLFSVATVHSKVTGRDQGVW
jgi:hypothetical protein